MKKAAKNNLDEMQEIQLLHIERNGCWLAFWGLLAVILIETFINQANFRQIVGEWIVFMCLALYLSVSCMYRGIWDRRLRPNFRTNLAASVIAGLVCAVVIFLTSYRNYGKLIGSLATGAFLFLFTSVITMIALTVSSRIYKQRIKKLESEDK